MFIRVYVSVHALAVQVIREENSLSLVLNQTQPHRFDHQDGKMEVPGPRGPSRPAPLKPLDPLS